MAQVALYMISLLCLGGVERVLGRSETNDTNIFNDDATELEYWEVYGDDYYDYHYPPEQMPIIMWVPKPFSLISMFCSYTIIREVCSEKRRNGRIGGTPINRMLMGMAIGDILFSFAYFLGTWAAPPIGAYGIEGKGTVGSCTFQGFLFQLGATISLFSSLSLSIYYLLIVSRRTEHDLEQMELWFHGTIWVVALVLAIYPIPLELYNSAGNTCWIETAPPSCFDEWCIRGSNPWPHQLVASLIPVICLLLSLVCMGIILYKVRQIENTSRKYAGSTTAHSSNIRASGGACNPTNSVNRQKSLAVAKQALFYTLAFLATYLLDSIAFVQYYTLGNELNQTFENICYSVLLPSAGTFNFFVFSRIRQMKTPEGRILRSVFYCLWCPTCTAPPMGSISTRITQTATRTTISPPSGVVRESDGGEAVVATTLKSRPIETMFEDEAAADFDNTTTDVEHGRIPPTSDDQDTRVSETGEDSDMSSLGRGET